MNYIALYTPSGGIYGVAECTTAEELSTVMDWAEAHDIRATVGL